MFDLERVYLEGFFSIFFVWWMKNFLSFFFLAPGQMYVERMTVVIQSKGRTVGSIIVLTR